MSIFKKGERVISELHPYKHTFSIQKAFETNYKKIQNRQLKGNKAIGSQDRLAKTNPVKPIKFPSILQAGGTHQISRMTYFLTEPPVVFSQASQQSISPLDQGPASREHSWLPGWKNTPGSRQGPSTSLQRSGSLQRHQLTAVGSTPKSRAELKMILINWRNGQKSVRWNSVRLCTKNHIWTLSKKKQKHSKTPKNEKQKQNEERQTSSSAAEKDDRVTVPTDWANSVILLQKTKASDNQELIKKRSTIDNSRGWEEICSPQQQGTGWNMVLVWGTRQK